jgi:hypothetical protein
MTKYSYAEMDSFKESLMVFSTASPAKKLFSRGDGKAKTILVSRPDFNIRFIELPPLPEDQISDMLKYKIKRLYPGDPARTFFDYQVIAFQGVKYAVLFITQKELSDSYRHLAESNALILPFHLMKRRILAGTAADAAYLFWQRHWVDCILVKDGKLSSANVIKRTASIKNDVAKFAKIIGSPHKAIAITLCGEKDEGGRLREQVSAVFENSVVDMISFDELVANRLERQDALFARRASITLPPLSRRIAIYALVAVILGVVFYVRFIDHLTRTRDHYNAIAQSLMEKNKDLSGRLTEIKSLEKQLIGLQAQRPIDVYLLLSELSRVLSADADIQSIVVKNDSFQIEATGLDPLKAEQKLKADSLFSAVEVTEMKPLPQTGLQSFRMRGKFQNAKTEQ